MHKILNSIVELSAEDKPEDKPEEKPDVSDAKKDVVTFSFGTHPVYTIVDLASGEVIEERTNIDEKISYNPLSKTLQIFYYGTAAPMVTASRTSIEPFYYGTMSPITSGVPTSYLVFDEDRSIAIGRSARLWDIDVNKKIYLTIGGNVYEINLKAKSV